MNTRKLFALFLCIVFLLCLSACTRGVAKRDLKIGFISTYGENDERTQAHLNGLNKAMEQADIGEKQFVFISDADPETAFDSVQSLVNDGCNLIFSGSKGLEDVMVQSATENNDVDFCVFEGIQTTNGLLNYHGFSFPQYQTRYISGVLAGEKMNDLIDSEQIKKDEAVLGYVATKDNAENISAYTAFYLGAKSVCDSVRLQVLYTFDENSQDNIERAAYALVSRGSKLIFQQSNQASILAEACNTGNAYYIGFMNAASNHNADNYLGTCTMDLTGCYSYAIQHFLSGDLPLQWCVGYVEPGLSIKDLNKDSFILERCFDTAKSSIQEKESGLIDGLVHVFDTATWTVNGERIKTTATDDLKDIYFGTEYISDGGYFMESEITSSPAFEFHIDGIIELNQSENNILESTGGEQA